MYKNLIWHVAIFHYIIWTKQTKKHKNIHPCTSIHPYTHSPMYIHPPIHIHSSIYARHRNTYYHVEGTRFQAQWGFCCIVNKSWYNYYYNYCYYTSSITSTKSKLCAGGKEKKKRHLCNRNQCKWVEHEKQPTSETYDELGKVDHGVATWSTRLLLSEQWIRSGLAPMEPWWKWSANLIRRHASKWRRVTTLPLTCSNRRTASVIDDWGCVWMDWCGLHLRVKLFVSTVPVKANLPIWSWIFQVWEILFWLVRHELRFSAPRIVSPIEKRE